MINDIYDHNISAADGYVPSRKEHILCQNVWTIGLRSQHQRMTLPASFNETEHVVTSLLNCSQKRNLRVCTIRYKRKIVKTVSTQIESHVSSCQQALWRRAQSGNMWGIYPAHDA